MQVVKKSTSKQTAPVVTMPAASKPTTVGTTAATPVKGKATTTKVKIKEKTTAPATTSTTVVKKDGTPDMRYAANKKAKTTVHVKKDGSADMRFKENKKHS
jgi:hypothetical protein